MSENTKNKKKKKLSCKYLIIAKIIKLKVMIKRKASTNILKSIDKIQIKKKREEKNFYYY